MRTARTPDSFRRAVRRHRAAGQRIGFVPTMGSLHEGHIALIRRARREDQCVAVSIFVNPLQFGPGEDFAGYPTNLRRDRRILRTEGVDLLYMPQADDLYPVGFATRVSVKGLGDRLCGRYRPGHFEGVTTVVAKLLSAAEPDRLYLGRKDYQQAKILERMVRDLDLGTRVILCPTVRDRDGLALSSRNLYLTPEERRWAPRLYQVLRAVASQIKAGRIRTPEAATRAVSAQLEGGPGRLQYAEALEAETLESITPLRGPLVLALAYFLGRARLIDNVAVSAPESGPPVRRGGRHVRS